MMDASGGFEDLMKEALDVIDRQLARENYTLQERPLAAAIDFVSQCIERVRYKDQNEFEPGNFIDYADSDWFKVIFSKIQSWYLSRYGEAMNNRHESGILGLTIAYGTPFLLKVPTTTVEPGTPEETIWVCFHDSVQPKEDVLSWLVNGPNLSAASRSDGMKVRRISAEVANRLRSIKIRLMGLELSDSRISELRGGIMPHLERAAYQISQSTIDDYKRAHWDLQMACEFTFKLLAQQRSGSFQQTHDLFCLYDRMPDGPIQFKRSLLSKIPNWERMAEWRYGGGASVSLEETFHRYRAALQIIDETLGAARCRFGLGKAKMHIRRPPWM